MTKLKYVKSMEINGISPLPHYYEEIYTNNVGIKELGFRGDRNYLFYSINGLGAGYYEESEMELSSRSVYEHFHLKKNRQVFFKRIDAILKEFRDKTKIISKTDVDKLGTKELAKLFLEANQLHGRAFSLYVVSQPYRMKYLEESIVKELRKRVATSRVNHYMAQLATSEKPTKLTREEIDWLKLLIKFRKKIKTKSIDIKTIKEKYPELYKGINKHFEKYKSLTLGDGNWQYDIGYYINMLKHDFKNPLESIERTYHTRLRAPKITSNNKKQLIKELRLNKSTVEDMEFLAEIGHTRLLMRIEGWLPFIKQIIHLDIALSKKLDLHDDAKPLLNYMSEQEIIEITKTGRVISSEELKKRTGKDSEFLMLNDNGTYKIYYDNEARKKFEKLVPKIDYSKTEELIGATAVAGHVKGTACVYIWGDDLAGKMEVIKKHPILVVGQTRPSMMSIIRLAKGIVTDEGGVTSHAAIVSRELGIPSVIGTGHATRTFKDGDKIEIDADNGIVRKLK